MFLWYVQLIWPRDKPDSRGRMGWPGLRRVDSTTCAVHRGEIDWVVLGQPEQILLSLPFFPTSLRRANNKEVGV